MRIGYIIAFLFLLNTAFSEMVFLPYYPFKIGERMLLTINVLGIYVGDQVINVEDLVFTNGKRVVVGSGHLYTTPFMSSFYKVDDLERTWFVPEDFVPLYYERWINEGNWKDNIRFNFFPEQQKVLIAQKVNNFRQDTVNFKGFLRNYFTLISAMRSVDYDYHILNNVNVEIDYLFGTAIKSAKFKPSFRTEKINNKVLDVIYLEEIGGIGMHFYISRDQFRTPIRLVIPAFEVIGFKTISVYVELKEFTPGSADIMPLADIPFGATNDLAVRADASVTNTNAVQANQTNTNSSANTNVKKKKTVSSSSSKKSGSVSSVKTVQKKPAVKSSASSKPAGK